MQNGMTRTMDLFLFGCFYGSYDAHPVNYDYHKMLLNENESYYTNFISNDQLCVLI